MPNEVVITGLGYCLPRDDEPDKLLQRVRENGDAGAGLKRPVVIPADLGGGEEMMAVVPGPDAAGMLGVRRPFPDRPTLMSFLAVDRALASARVETSGARGDEIGLVLETCFGPSATVEHYLRVLLAKGPAQVSPINFSRAVSNSVVGELARRHNLRGPSTAVLGSSALGYATDLLRAGSARQVVCVGVDEVRDLHLWAYRQAGLLDGGLWLGEGAAALVLESREHAEARHASILCAIAGYSMSFSGESVFRITGVTADSIARCMTAALRRSGRDPSAVESVVSLANGDRALIGEERDAVQRVIGREPMWLRPKLVFGETFGSSEAIASLVATAMLRGREPNGYTARTCLVNACRVGGGVSSLVLEATE